MAWIESHQELRGHPKTKRLAKRLKIQPYAAAGLLHFLWYWAVDYAPDGDLSGFEDWEIADAAGYEKDPAKLMDALIFSGFLDNTEQGIKIHDWDDYAGRTIEQREEKKKKNRERQQKYRERHKDEKTDNASVTPEKPENKDPVTQDNESVTRDITPSNEPTEHNITEHNITIHNITEQDSNTPPIPPTGGGEGKPPEKPPDLQKKRFDEFWERYPKKQGKGAAEKSWAKIKPTRELHERIMAAVQDNIDHNLNWKRDNGQYIPNPSTWLNQRRWEDEIPKATQRQGGEPNAGRTGGYAEFRPSTGFRRADPVSDADTG